MWSGFKAKGLNTCRELAANRPEPVKQADPVPGPDHDQNKNLEKKILKK